MLEGLEQNVPIVLNEVNATMEQIVTEPNIGVVFTTEDGVRVCIFVDDEMDYFMNVL